MQKYILLDIDGVMVQASSWKPVELLPDGFYKFNPRSQENLDWLLEKTKATIILITSHRNNFNSNEWITLLKRRLKFVKKVSIIDESNSNSHKKVDAIFDRSERLLNVLSWVENYGNTNEYVIIDDDNSLESLPIFIKEHWVKTYPAVGLNTTAAEKALSILNASH